MRHTVYLCLVINILNYMLVDIYVALRSVGDLHPVLSALSRSSLTSQGILGRVILHGMGDRRRLTQRLRRSHDRLRRNGVRVLLHAKSMDRRALRRLASTIRLGTCGFLLLVPSLRRGTRYSLGRRLHAIIISRRVHRVCKREFCMRTATSSLVLIVLARRASKTRRLQRVYFHARQLCSTLRLAAPLVLDSPFRGVRRLSSVC